MLAPPRVSDAWLPPVKVIHGAVTDILQTSSKGHSPKKLRQLLSTTLKLKDGGVESLPLPLRGDTLDKMPPRPDNFVQSNFSAQPAALFIAMESPEDCKDGARSVSL